MTPKLQSGMQFKDRTSGHLLVIQKVNTTTIEYLDFVDEVSDKRVTSRLGWELEVERGDLVLQTPKRRR